MGEGGVKPLAMGGEGEGGGQGEECAGGEMPFGGGLLGAIAAG